jgi:hypothetical protein
LMEQSLFIELIHCTKGTLDSIKNLAQLSRGKLTDKEYGEFLYKAITKDIEEHNLLLNTFLKYIESTTPITKRDTVGKLIEEVLKKHHLRLEEKKVKIFKKYEKDLPEAIVPDKQLIFILDSVLQYAIALVSSDGNIELSARSIILPREGVKDQEYFKRNGKFIEIMVVFTSYREEPGKGLGVFSPKERVASDLIFRLVEIVAKMNQGAIRFEVDETESKHRILVRFPTERRKMVYYQTADEPKRTLASLR